MGVTCVFPASMWCQRDCRMVAPRWSWHHAFHWAVSISPRSLLCRPSISVFVSNGAELLGSVGQNVGFYLARNYLGQILRERWSRTMEDLARKKWRSAGLGRSAGLVSFTAWHSPLWPTHSKGNQHMPAFLLSLLYHTQSSALILTLCACTKTLQYVTSCFPE